MLNNRESGIGNKRIKNLGFTLVETVFVIAIIGILLAIVLPVVSSMRDKTRKLQDVANLKRIADAYKTYLEKFGEVPVVNFSGGSYPAAWKSLAGHEKPSKDACILNDPNVWISSGDKWTPTVTSETITRYINGKFNFYDNYDSEAFAFDRHSSSIVFRGNYGFVLSYAFICGLNLNMPQDTTPLGFTRGLMANGLWNETYGVYGSSGGYVVYLDGHVQWFDGSKPAKFLKWDNSGWTSDIRQAVPGNGESGSSAYIGCGNGDLYNNLPSANNPMFLHHFGTGDLL